MKDERSLKGEVKGIRLSEDEIAIIREIQSRYGLSGFSKTICHIIQEYAHLQERNQKLLEENQKLREENQKQMTRIRLASNGADVNGQVIVEVLNALCWQFQASEFHSTEQMLHPVIEEAQSTVKDRIARFKQAKDSKPKS